MNIYNVYINNKKIVEDVTIGQAFNAIDNWCYDNKAHYNIHNVHTAALGLVIYITKDDDIIKVYIR